jgi:hypothetical protein
MMRNHDLPFSFSKESCSGGRSSFLETDRRDVLKKLNNFLFFSAGHLGRIIQHK